MDRYRSEKSVSMTLAAACLLLIAALTASPAPAAEDGKPVEQVRITAEHLTADTGGDWAEFSGKVRAEQGGTVITARRLKVFYAHRNTAAAGLPASRIERLEASGEVTIRFDRRVARADEARYDAEDRVLVLTGTPAKVVEGWNSVTGGRIVVDRAANRISVEKSQDDCVEAVFFTKDRGLR